MPERRVPACTRHNIEAFLSRPSYLGGVVALGPAVLFWQLPFELAHWVKSLRAVSPTDMLIVAETSIVADTLRGAHETGALRTRDLKRVTVDTTV